MSYIKQHPTITNHSRQVDADGNPALVPHGKLEDVIELTVAGVGTVDAYQWQRLDYDAEDNMTWVDFGADDAVVEVTLDFVDTYRNRPIHCVLTIDGADYVSNNIVLTTEHPEKYKFQLGDFSGTDGEGYVFADGIGVSGNSIRFTFAGDDRSGDGSHLGLMRRNIPGTAKTDSIGDYYINQNDILQGYDNDGNVVYARVATTSDAQAINDDHDGSIQDVNSSTFGLFTTTNLPAFREAFGHPAVFTKVFGDYVIV